MKNMSPLSVVLLALVLAAPVTAQVNVGLIAGGNLATLRIDPEPLGVEIGNRTGFGLGGVLSFDLSRTWGLQFEPMYLWKGARTNVPGTDVDAAVIQLPAMVKLLFGSGGTRFYLMGGPEVAYVLSVELGGEDIKDVVKSVEFGVGVGAGVSVPAGNNSLFLEARYAVGLSDVNDDPLDPDTSIKTKGYQLFAGITFPIGGSD